MPKKYEAIGFEKVPPSERAIFEEIAKLVANRGQPRYEWSINPAVERGAIGHVDGDEVGRVFRDNAQVPERRWRWRVAAIMAPDHRETRLCQGWAKTANEAALLAEASYDLLMERNLGTAEKV